MPDAEKVAAVRAQLPATAAGIYLNAGSAGPLPAETAAAMTEVAERELRVGRGHTDSWLETLERMAEARAAVAAVLAADVDSVALTHSTTDALNVALSALPWRAGDRVLTTRHEHPGGLGPLLALRDRHGVEAVFVDAGDGDDDDRAVAAFAAALDERTRAIMVSHVLWTTGGVLPVGRIADIARAAGVPVVVDGAQAVGAIRVAVDELGVDAYALPGQKWLLGPEGMGALWVSAEFLAGAVPAARGALSYASLDTVGEGLLHADARRFEATGFHRPSILGLARSCGWLTMYVGLPWAVERAGAVAARAAARLAAVPGVTLLTPRERMATLVTFRIDGWPADRALEELGARTFAILRSVPPLDALRISVGFWTTDDEIERFADGVELLAAHTPETLPARRGLTVLGSDGRPID